MVVVFILSARGERLCCADTSCDGSVRYWGDGVKLIYRHYATLYFVFAVDQQESDLGILDLIQGAVHWWRLWRPTRAD